MNKIHLPEVEIVKLYTVNKLSMKEIGSKFGVSLGPVRNILKRLKVSIRDVSTNSRKYNLNEDYFNMIDTENKAQILGMIYADGCLISSKDKYSHSMTISLEKKDQNYLEFIKNELKYAGPLFINKNNFTLTIGSKKIYNNLLNLGLTPRKSLTITFPTEDSLPKKLYSHFIRGYFEGDGCICLSKKKDERFLSGRIDICGTLEFLTKVKDILESNLDIHCGIYQKKSLKNRNINCHSLIINGNNQCVKFLEYIYNGYQKTFNFVMERKYNKYLELKKILEYRESIQDQLDKEFRDKISKSSTGRIVSAETKEKQKQGNLRYSQLHRYREIWIQKDGIIYNVRGVKYFCKEFNLPYTYFCGAINPNNTKIKSCHGWTSYNYDPNNPPAEYIKKFY